MRELRQLLTLPTREEQGNRIAQKIRSVRPKRPRDSQRAKVYRSERYAIAENDLVDWKAVLAWHHEVTAGRTGKRIAESFGIAPSSLARVAIRPTPGGRGSNADARRIHLGIGEHRSKRIHLHELAHSITGLLWDYRYLAGHGPEWCGVLLHLVLVVFGEDARRELSSNLIAGKVKVKHWRPRR